LTRLRPRITSALAFTGLVLLLLTSPAEASNGPAQAVIGNKGPVNIPVDGDPQTFYRMPSSISWSLDHQADLDLFLFFSESQARNSLNDFDSSGSTIGGSAGLILAPGRLHEDASEEDWNEYTDARKFTFGMGIYVAMAGGGGDGSKLRYTTYPETIELTTGIQFLDFTLGGSFTATDWLAFGASLHIIYGTVDIKSLVGGDGTPLGGSPTIQGVPFPGNPSYADFLDLFSNDQATDPTTYFEGDVSGVQFSGTLSVSLRPTDWLGFGLSYRFKSWGPPLTGEGDVDATRTFDQALSGLAPAVQNLFLATLPNGGANGFINGYDVELEGLTVPRAIRLSAVVWPHERIMLGMEVGWIDWHSSFNEIELSLEGGDNEDVNFVIGAQDVVSTTAPRFRSQWVFSLQGAFAITDSVTLRAGFNYGEVALNARRAEGGPSAGYVSTTFTFGAGWQIPWVDGLSVNGLVEHAFYNSERGDLTSDAPTVRNSFLSSKQWFIHLGVGYRF
jgi:long-subunit fatty acid transport protein